MSDNRASEAVLDRVARLLYRQIGLRPEPTLRGRLRRCIRDDAADRDQDIETYLADVLDQSEVLQGLVNRVTVQETAFLRHAEHFDVLAREILPRLPGKVTIWSAGCANGQEAFSLAMLLEEHGIDGSVIATDLSTAALQRTQAARYSARELAGLSAERIDRHLTRIGHEWEINRSLRDRVTIVQRNLLDAIPHQVHGCHVVFCRNVLIYFAPEHARAFLDRLADAAPDAAVFLGSAETIWPVSDRFDTVQAAGTFFYRPRAQRPPVANQTPSPEPPTTRPALDRKAVRRSDAQPPPSVSVESSDDGSTVEWLTLAGQRTAARGDHKSAVVAFRKCAYLAPDDPIAHLHLGLALDAAGDRAPAQRAYAAARQALLAGDPTLGDVATEGYTTVEFLRLLDTKMRVPSR